MDDKFSSFVDNVALVNEIRIGKLAGQETLINALAMVINRNVPGGREYLNNAVNLFSEMRKQELVKEEESEMTLKSFDSVINKFRESQEIIDYLMKKP